jgi:hypothetical protein
VLSGRKWSVKLVRMGRRLVLVSLLQEKDEQLRRAQG